MEKYLVTGTADYSTMSENHEILVLRNEYADYIYDWTFHVGDTVKFAGLMDTGAGDRV